MSSGIDVDEGVIQAIAIAIEGLEVTWFGDNRIGADKSPQHGVIEPGVVVI